MSAVMERSMGASGQGTSHGTALAAGVLGFALGGFFDGILLHQVLQWHHFLSLVPGDALRDIRAQILADGLFHVAVYLIAAVGLWLLWRARAGLTGGSGARLLGAVLLGFGIWQVVDVVGFHWAVGIHRIRVDVPDPLLWDIGWLIVIGLPPLAAGLWLRRRDGNPPPGGHATAVAAALAALVLASGPIAALSPAGATTVLVLFRNGIGPDQAFAAAIAAGGRVAWSDPSGGMLAVDLRDGGSVLALYRGGALLVGTSAITGGCLAWTQRPA
ncbi:DUF2243 domain-containing protein [Muricoccus vinaceus]|uniref:DUF2243 domain-containing protein n=1 Tax=Muricoccus vinaceus TaxID=424704 RepID=A0ABV6IXW3_9PROT